MKFNLVSRRNRNALNSKTKYFPTLALRITKQLRRSKNLVTVLYYENGLQRSEKVLRKVGWTKSASFSKNCNSTKHKHRETATGNKVKVSEKYGNNFEPQWNYLINSG